MRAGPDKVAAYTVDNAAPGADELGFVAAHSCLGTVGLHTVGTGQQSESSMRPLSVA